MIGKLFQYASSWKRRPHEQRRACFELLILFGSMSHKERLVFLKHIGAVKK